MVIPMALQVSSEKPIYQEKYVSTKTPKMEILTYYHRPMRVINIRLTEQTVIIRILFICLIALSINVTCVGLKDYIKLLMIWK